MEQQSLWTLLKIRIEFCKKNSHWTVNELEYSIEKMKIKNLSECALFDEENSPSNIVVFVEFGSDEADLLNGRLRRNQRLLLIAIRAVRPAIIALFTQTISRMPYNLGSRSDLLFSFVILLADASLREGVVSAGRVPFPSAIHNSSFRSSQFFQQPTFLGTSCSWIDWLQSAAGHSHSCKGRGWNVSSGGRGRSLLVAVARSASVMISRGAMGGVIVMLQLETRHSDENLEELTWSS